MTTQTHQPWKPTCWVGGLAIVMPSGGKPVIVDWIDGEEPLALMFDYSRAKYAATKATAAILRSMRK